MPVDLASSAVGLYYQYLQLGSLTSGVDIQHECQSFGSSIACGLDATFLCLWSDTLGLLTVS